MALRASLAVLLAAATLATAARKALGEEEAPIVPIVPFAKARAGDWSTYVVRRTQGGKTTVEVETDRITRVEGDQVTLVVEKRGADGKLREEQPERYDRTRAPTYAAYLGFEAVTRVAVADESRKALGLDFACKKATFLGGKKGERPSEVAVWFSSDVKGSGVVDMVVTDPSGAEASWELAGHGSGDVALSEAPAKAIAWSRPTFKWGADAQGGDPYVFYRPDQPDVRVGFEVEIADEIARRLGTRAEFFQNDWDALIPAMNRGDCDVVMNGIEVTPDHAVEVEFSRPYYVFQEELTVRLDDRSIASLADLKGKRVGTLSGSFARAILEQLPGVEIVTYSGVVEPYKEIVNGRLDAVLMDVPIAVAHAHPNPRLRRAVTIGRGLYAVAVRKGERAKVEAVDAALAAMIEDGSLRRILEKWKLWSDVQGELTKGRELTDLYSRVSAQEQLRASNAGASNPGASNPGTGTVERPAGATGSTLSNLARPLLSGALMTLFLSVTAFVVAVLAGLPIALVRIYAPKPLGWLAVGYVEIARGTPPLIQLMLLYYGLPSLGITMPAIVTAIFGLGLNYAAYESEIYRAAILAIPQGQSEAALSIGMSRAQALRLVILPQALRISLPASTNDFIALFKDSSLVSVITVVELTKTFSIYGAATYSYGMIGAITAALYLCMSLPLAAVARTLEKRLENAR